ncbi:MAG: chitin disaccharide deacetylase [Clostridium sp.]
MIKLIINADDLGLSKGVNLGIIEAHKNGIVTSSTLMTNMAECDHALNLIKDNPNLGVGIHLVLTAGKPISNNVPSLINGDGYFKKINDIIMNGKVEDIKREFISQIERFYSLGLNPSHIDSHHHVHGIEGINPIVLELSKEYSIPVRNVNNRKFSEDDGVKTTEYFSEKFYGKNISTDYLKELLSETRGYESVEIMCHPAYIDYELYNMSSYNKERAKELFVLTSSNIKEFIKAQHIQLISYKDI